MNADEFQLCMNMLASTKLGSTTKGQSELVQLAVQQMNSDEDPIIIEDEHVERYILCATQVLPYFSVSKSLIFTMCHHTFANDILALKIVGTN